MEAGRKRSVEVSNRNRYDRKGKEENLLIFFTSHHLFVNRPKQYNLPFWE